MTGGSARGALDAAGAAAVDELERGDRRTAATTAARRRGQLAGRDRLHPADGEPAQRRPGGCVPHAGDLRLVGHQPDQPEARPRRRPAGARAAASAAECTGERRTPTCTRPPAAAARRRGRGRPAAPAAAPGGTTASIRSSWSVESTIRVTARGRGLVGGQPAQRRPVGRRVADDDVVADRVLAAGRATAPRAACRPAPRRSPGGRAPAAGRPAAHRLAGDPDRLARPPGGPGRRRWRRARRGRRRRTAGRGPRSRGPAGPRRSASVGEALISGAACRAGRGRVNRITVVDLRTPRPGECADRRRRRVTEAPAPTGEPRRAGATGPATSGPWPRWSARRRPTRSPPCSRRRRRPGGGSGRSAAGTPSPASASPRTSSSCCDRLAGIGPVGRRRPGHRRRGHAAAPAQRRARCAAAGR